MVSVASVTSTALNIGIMLLGGLLFCGIVGGALWLYLKKKRYSEYKCVVWERDGFGQLNETYDKAGIFVDNKTKNKRFFLKKANVGLNADNVPYIPSKRKIVYLLRTGLKNFQFIKPNISNPSINLDVGEEDVNWAINAYDRQKKLFNQNILMQYLPFIALAFTSIIILIIFIYFFKDFSVLKDVALALKEASQAQQGTVIKLLFFVPNFALRKMFQMTK